MTSATPATINEVVVTDPPYDIPAAPQRARVQLNVNPDLGILKLDSIRHKYFSISDTYAEFWHDVILRPEVRKTHFGLAIMNCPKGTVKFNNGKWVDVVNGQAYFTFNPGVEEFHYFNANHPMKSQFVDVDSGYLTRLLVEQEPVKGTPLYDLLERVERNEFAEGGRRISTPVFHNIISSMFSCPVEGTLGNLMLEGALQQLLALQFTMIGNEEPSRKNITHRDRDRIISLKEHLDLTFNEDHSIVDLSKKFGINQNKLKTQFREMFGVPVIGYLFDRKMEHARALLLDKGMFVSEVASVVGYRNSNHFATAFKRKFGINPSKLKS